jgi:bacterial/archaeal transporter family-2 protein
MSNTYLFLLLALIAGAMIPTQAALNGRMAEAVGSSILAALISFVVGTASLIVYVLAVSMPLGSLADARSAPAWTWLAGVLGAFFVAAATILVPRLGVALSFSLIVAGQMGITLILDHFGLLGMEQRPISLARFVGVLLVVAGVVLIRKF